MPVKNILCVGAGYVGGPTMAVLADQCPDIQVKVVDLMDSKIKAWNSDNLPVFEPGLLEVVQRARGRNLFFEVITPEAIAQADMIFISVNTPTKEYGEGAGMASDLQYWESSTRTILAHARPGTIIVEKSTVPVKTAEAISRILNYNNQAKRFPVLSNPEFLAEGTAIRDLENPDRLLIGHELNPEGESAAKTLVDIYARWVPRDKLLVTNVWSSELSKLSANAFLAQRVSSINAMSAICEKTDADVGEISRAIGMDNRIGSRFLEAGVGFGGSCFRKDILNMVYICRSLGLDEVAHYWQQVVELNDYQTHRFFRQMVSTMFNTVAAKKIAMFGFAFKPDTNDTRDTPALKVALKLLEEKAHLVITDPKALGHAQQDMEGFPGVSFEPDPYQAAHNAHAIALMTHWKEYRELDWEKIYHSMLKPATVFDGRNWLNHKALFEIGFNVVPIGKKALLHY
ncbi:MAG: nucleotide sugar dehydrogenase [Deltaproteobacteria bacterium]|nr:nucleotide sugar dehydrogenase [Deltaproteobacteria bacterium]